MKVDQSKLDRQNECIDIWWKNNLVGTLECATGFGKTWLAILATKRLLKTIPNLLVMVVVPTDYLRDQWRSVVKSFNLERHIKIDTIHTWLSHERLGCHLLVLDEIHGYTGGDVFSTIFDRVKRRYTLGLTAKERDKEEDKKVLQENCPIVERVPLAECLKNGWVAPYVSYNLGLELNKKDRDTYNRMHKQFIKYFSTFDFSLKRMYAAMSSESTRKAIANDLNWEPQMIMVHAMQCNRVMQRRKHWLYTHRLLLETAIEIINKFPDRRIITFAEETSMADKLYEAIPNSSIYHSSIGTEILDEAGNVIARGKKVKIKGKSKTRYFDSKGKSYTWKEIKEEYPNQKLTRKSGDKVKEYSLKQFQKGETDIIHTARSLNEGVDIQNLDFSIKTSFNSTDIDSLQRTGRVGRIDQDNPDKRAIEVNLCIRDTQSEKWLKKSQRDNPMVKWIESIEEIV